MEKMDDASGDNVSFRLTLAAVDQAEAEFREIMRTGKYKLLTPLPRRVRLRLALTRAVDHTAVWLTDRQQYRAAEWLWAVTGLMRGGRHQ